MDLWRLLTARRIEVEEATEEVKELMSTLTLEQYFDQQVWTQFMGLAQIIPDGDVLPVRAAYGGPAAWQVGVNPYTIEDGAWYTIPDILAAKLLTGKSPQIVRAVRFTPHGRLRGLRPIMLRGQVLIDPVSSDFFRAVIEERYRLNARTDLPPEERRRLDAFLKVLENGAGYGIYGEFNRCESAADASATVSVFGADDMPFRSDGGDARGARGLLLPSLRSVHRGGGPTDARAPGALCHRSRRVVRDVRHRLDGDRERSGGRADLLPRRRVSSSAPRRGQGPLVE
jgi:hypothetical protein